MICNNLIIKIAYSVHVKGVIKDILDKNQKVVNWHDIEYLRIKLKLHIETVLLMRKEKYE